MAGNPGSYEKLTFAPAMRKGNMLFISGLTASQVDPAIGKSIVRGDIVAQTTEIYQKIKVILETAGEL